MFANVLLTFYRAMTRHKLYAALNVLGLAVGIAVFLILMLFVRFQTSFEQWLPGVRGVYLLRMTGHGLFAPIGVTTSTPPVVLEDLQHDDPHLIGTRAPGFDVKISEGGKLREETLTAVDPSFFSVLDLPLVAGSKATALDSPDNLLISEAKAKQYFGSVQVVGRTLPIAIPRHSGLKTILISDRIVGVLKDLPASSDLKFDFITPLSPRLIGDDAEWRRSWGRLAGTTYLRLAGPAEARALDGQLDSFVDRHARREVSLFGKTAPHDQLQLRTTPLTAQHLNDPKDAAVVAALGGVGLLTLLIAALNYVNLATARSAMRATEVAIRKVMGATRSALMVQFLGESLAVALLAALLATALCELALPAVNVVGGLSLKLRYDGRDGLIPFILATAVVVGLSAGVYPALVLVGFQPAQVLASARSPGRGRMGGRVREVLVTLQFAAAIALIAGTTVIVAQMAHLKHGELGFQREGLIVVPALAIPI
jgi:putative ABC transport system permease protein